ncbi:hypothetical protein [Allonocardiopsis opalescens]|uniref:Uncharacterized protein n=1 Tax=Allonocardiopsis opalescens TaxID=1144618 RepID=A0A2T0PVQ7_9ACTN|nr:hypothetical protein [Allonocardiopsis opalescens]PRX95587.1 hypothetical protein CLV72_109196 [Allonocardiopsis opalescens]
MSILHIAITGAGDTPEEAERTMERAVEALRAAGIEPYRAWVEDTSTLLPSIGSEAP